MKLQTKRAGCQSRSPSGAMVGRESIQVSPAAMRKSVTKAKLKRPKLSGATSAKRDTPRIASGQAASLREED